MCEIRMHTIAGTFAVKLASPRRTVTTWARTWDALICPVEADPMPVAGVLVVVAGSLVVVVGEAVLVGAVVEVAEVAAASARLTAARAGDHSAVVEQ